MDRTLDDYAPDPNPDHLQVSDLGNEDIEDIVREQFECDPFTGWTNRRIVTEIIERTIDRPYPANVDERRGDAQAALAEELGDRMTRAMIIDHCGRQLFKNTAYESRVRVRYQRRQWQELFDELIGVIESERRSDLPQ